MKLGILRFGNDYNFKPENIRLRPETSDKPAETRDTIKNLNKIELRYNTRTTEPNYPAMKSLYKWRSIFGYRLGGLIQQATVKFAELKRHSVNAKNFHAAREMSKLEAKGDRKLEGTLDTYVRNYSTRDIIAAAKNNRNMSPEKIKYLKYMKWDEFGPIANKQAAKHDHSIRKLVVDSFGSLSKGTFRGSFDETNRKGQEALDRKREMSDQNIRQFTGNSDYRSEREFVVSPELSKKIYDREKAEARPNHLKRFVTGNLKAVADRLGLTKLAFRFSLISENIKKANAEVKEELAERKVDREDYDTFGEYLKDKLFTGENRVKMFFDELSLQNRRNDEKVDEKFGKADFKTEKKNEVEKLVLDYSAERSVTSEDVKARSKHDTSEKEREARVNRIIDENTGPSLRKVLNKVDFDKAGEDLPLRKNK